MGGLYQEPSIETRDCKALLTMEGIYNYSGWNKRCCSTKTISGLQRSWKMLDFHFVLFVLFGRRQGRDLFQGPKYEAGTNPQGRWMRDDIQDKAILCPDLDEILNKVPNIVLTCTSTSKFNFTPSSLPDQIKRISQVLMDCGVKRLAELKKYRTSGTS